MRIFILILIFVSLAIGYSMGESAQPRFGTDNLDKAKFSYEKPQVVAFWTPPPQYSAPADSWTPPAGYEHYANAWDPPKDWNKPQTWDSPPEF